MKVSFLTSLWSWANLCSVDNTNSLIDFFCLGRGVDEYKGFLFPCLFPVFFPFVSVIFFFINILPFTDQKKKKQNVKVKETQFRE